MRVTDAPTTTAWTWAICLGPGGGAFSLLRLGALIATLSLGSILTATFEGYRCTHNNRLDTCKPVSYMIQ